jgi:r-opsin
MIFLINILLSHHPQAAFFVPLTVIAYCYIHILYVVVSAKKIQSSKEKNKTEYRLAAVVMGIVGLVS